MSRPMGARSLACGNNAKVRYAPCSFARLCACNCSGACPCQPLRLSLTLVLAIYSARLFLERSVSRKAGWKVRSRLSSVR